MAASVVAGKDRFTSLDTLAVVRELRALGRAHVDKTFDLGTEADRPDPPGHGCRQAVPSGPTGQYAAVIETLA